MRVIPRPSITALSTSSPLQLHSRVPSQISVSRCLHQPSSRRAKEPVIFKNSLEKTLESHRSSNRAGIIRRVFAKDSPASPRAVRKLDKNSREGPIDSSSSVRQAPRLQKSNRRPARHNCSPSQPATRPSQQIEWSRLPEQSPWMRLLDEDCTPSDNLIKLDAEIRALETYLTPTPAEQQTVNQVTSEVTSLLRDVAPQTPLVIGTRRTGFALGHSDLDFIIPVPDSARFLEQIRKPSASRPQMLEQYREILQNAKVIFGQQPSWDRVYTSGKNNSTLAATHRPTGLSVHLHCGEGLPSFIEYIQDYHAEYPSVRPLYMVTRLILERNGLYGSHKSGIGSDALLMLLVTFLKMNHGRFRGQNNLGSQLLAILHTYGTEIDLATTGVSVDPPSFFNADTVKEDSASYESDSIPAYLRGQRSLINLKRTAAVRRNVPATGRLCVQDPANYMNDLGRGCARTREIQDAFSHAHRRLKASLDAWEGPTSGNSTARSSSILTHVLRANFYTFHHKRAQIVGLAAEPRVQGEVYENATGASLYVDNRNIHCK